MSPLNLIHLLLVEYRWMPIVYFAIYTVEVEVISTIFIEKTKTSSGIGDYIQCVGAKHFGEQVRKGIGEVLWADYKFELSSVACVSGSGPPVGPPFIDMKSATPSAERLCAINIMAFMFFVGFYFLWPLYLVVTKPGKWRGITWDADYYTSMKEASLSLAYRRYVLLASFLIIVFAVWILIEGLYNKSSGFIQSWVLGFLTVFLALPKQQDKHLDHPTVNHDQLVGKLKVQFSGIIARMFHFFGTTIDEYSYQLFFLHDETQFVVADPKSALPCGNSSKTSPVERILGGRPVP